MDWLKTLIKHDPADPLWPILKYASIHITYPLIYITSIILFFNVIYFVCTVVMFFTTDFIGYSYLGLGSMSLYCGTIGFVSILIRKQILEELPIRLNEMYLFSSTDINHPEVQKIIIRAKKVFLVCVTYTFFIFVILTPFGDFDEIYLIMKLEKIYGLDKNQFFSIGQTVATTVGIFIIAHIQATVIYVAQYYLAQEMIQYVIFLDRVNQLSQEKAVFESQFQERVKAFLIEALQHNLSIARYMELRNQTLNAILPILPTIGLAVPSTLIAHFLTTNKFGTFNDIRLGCVLNGAIVDIIFGAVLSQECIDRQQDIYQALLVCPWYKWNVENRRIYMMLLIRLKEHFPINFHGIFTIDNTFFIRAYKMTFSLLQVVWTKQKRKRY